MQGIHERRADRRLLLDLYVLLNIGGLIVDILLAHGSNGFRERAEYAPLAVSLGGATLLAIGLGRWIRQGDERTWRRLGLLVGWAAIGLGIAGLVYHLNSHFFKERTLASLVYTAPFAAPLAYTGLGLLLLMNRLEDWRSERWGQWVLVLALGGFVGNFVFSVADHAQNGFFWRAEWIPVVASAIAVGCLVPPLVTRVERTYLRLLLGVMAMEAVVGFVGFAFHGYADLYGPSPSLLPNVLYGAPLMAPLLFPNLALLVVLGIYGVSSATRRL